MIRRTSKEARTERREYAAIIFAGLVMTLVVCAVALNFNRGDLGRMLIRQIEQLM